IIAGTWSSAHLTDGWIPRGLLRRLVPFDGFEAAEELVRVGLWHDDEDGYWFHDWTEYQPTKAQVESKRAEDAQRKRGVKKEKASKRNPSGIPADSKRSRAGIQPSRPVPPRPPIASS